MANGKHTGISVVVIDDDPFALDGLVKDLTCPEITEIVPCLTAEACLEAITLRHPDVAVIDLLLDGEVDAGVQLVREIKECEPRVRCIIVAGSDPRGRYLMEAILAGAQGFARKGYAKDRLSTVVTRLAGGEVTIEPSLAHVMLDYLKHPHLAQKPKLSGRQTEVLHLIQQGKTNAEIAEALGISVKTVKSFVRQIMVKYNLAGRAGRERLRVLSQILSNDPR